MRILVPQSIFYIPTTGGENRANRAWLEQMAREGHECRVVAPAFGPPGPAGSAAHARELARLGIRPRTLSPFVATYPLNGVQVHALTQRTLLPGYVIRQIHEFAPTWILVSSLDPGQLLLDTCMRVSPLRVVYLAHTPQHFPFGPDSLAPNPSAAALLRQVSAIVSIGRQTARYVRHYTGREPLVLHPPVYGPRGGGPHDDSAEGFITLINPSAIKGISIFVRLAREFPRLRFGALAGWATTAADRQELRTLPNVVVWDAVNDIQEVLARTRILLAPSLYREGFGLVVIEAMRCGIPVLASDYAGLVDAKLDVEYLLPIRPITRYTSRFDDRGFPIPVVPQQDIGPWVDALRTLSAHRERYTELSRASRAAARQFLASIRNDSLSQALQNLAADRGRDERCPGGQEKGARAADEQLGARMKEMSSPRRTLLALRLGRPGIEQGGGS